MPGAAILADPTIMATAPTKIHRSCASSAYRCIRTPRRAWTSGTAGRSGARWTDRTSGHPRTDLTRRGDRPAGSVRTTRHALTNRRIRPAGNPDHPEYGEPPDGRERREAPRRPSPRTWTCPARDVPTPR
ncbi:hypothetical protein GCM10022419_117690 [Nonomuraea rosea]|uniref:Uncharacterized protein n=1 Tax=Nonomuraea rosea TaxID=638574 RepID=A0ABP6ZP02_9ACTN